MKSSMTLMLLITLMSSLVFASDPPKLGIVWYGKSGTAMRTLAGLEKGLDSCGTKFDIEFQKELEDLQQFTKVFERFEKEKNGIVVFRSTGTRFVAKHKPKIPTFIGGANHPGKLGAIKNLSAPEGTVTGVSYYIPVKYQFRIFENILPKLKKIHLLLEEGHPSGLINKKETEEVCLGKSYQCSYTFSTSVDNLVKTVAALKSQVSAFIIGNQSLITENARKIVQAAELTPVLSFSEKPVYQGALGGFLADDVKLGILLAQSVCDVLVKGKSISAVPVKFDPDPKFVVNTESAEKLNIRIPFEILRVAKLVPHE